MLANHVPDTRRLASPSLVAHYAEALATGEHHTVGHVNDATDMMSIAGNMKPHNPDVIVALAKSHPELAREALDVIYQWLLGVTEPYDREPLTQGLRDLALEHPWLRLPATHLLVREIEKTPNHYLAKIAGHSLDIALPHPDPRKIVTNALFDRLTTLDSTTTEADVHHICDALVRLDAADKNIGIQDGLAADIERFGGRICLGVRDVLLMTLGRMRATNVAPTAAPAP